MIVSALLVLATRFLATENEESNQSKEKQTEKTNIY
jgi:hypothetical protein